MADRSRLVSNAVFLGGHLVNAGCVLYALRDGQVSLKDRRVEDMKTQMFKFLTIWNLMFQMVYLLVTVLCEVLELRKTGSGLVGALKTAKQMLFDSLLAPTTMAIVFVFWPMFVYNRELMYPAFIDKAIGSMANYMMHAYIFLVMVWEMRYMTPKENYRGLCLTSLAVLCVTYIAVLLHNYESTGLFPYPILYMLYGSIYFPTLLLVCIVLLYAAYHAQWPLRRLVSVHQERRKKNKSK